MTSGEMSSERERTAAVLLAALIQAQATIDAQLLGRGGQSALLSGGPKQFVPMAVKLVDALRAALRGGGQE